jgi:hypothetical protein
MNPVAVVFKINNGFLIVDPNNEANGSYFVSTFDPAKLSKAEVDHEAAVRQIISTFPAMGGKISAIKAVRDYCIEVNYDKYRGLKDAKDHVEYVRGDWYYAPVRKDNWR